MSVLTPAEVFTAPRREGDRETGIGKPLYEQKDEGGRRAPARYNIGEVDTEVE